MQWFSNINTSGANFASYYLGSSSSTDAPSQTYEGSYALGYTTQTATGGTSVISINNGTVRLQNRCSYQANIYDCTVIIGKFI